ncbi:DUF6049 family protein [Microbacterium halophytorum]|uniref:DUF6049 family protein n=1 Tax=Microbacterium halophytorum TaxID=2067568 RepID=UPI000CFAD93C|nr:DUF6049 family protein [Microbacterium halophytorum]
MLPIRRRISTTARSRRTLAALPAALVALAVFAGAPAAGAAPQRAGTVPGAVGAAAQGPDAGARAATAPDVRTQTDDAAAAEPTLELTLPDFGVVDGEFTATIELGFPSDGNPLAAAVEDPIPAGRIVLERAADPLAGGGELSDWLSGDDEPRMIELGSVETDEVSRGSSTTAELTVEIDDEDGPYPIIARFEPDTGSSDLADRAVATVAEDTPDITTVVPLTAPASSRGLLTGEQLANLTAPDGTLTALLDGAEGTSAVLAVDPAIPAAIRVLGAAAPTSATSWLDQLIAMPNERFALQFGDADVATQIAEGLEEPLSPTSLAPYIAGAGDVSDAGIGDAGDEPKPTATPGTDPVDLSLEELLDIGDAVDDLYWPDPRIAGADTVAAVSDWGGRALMPSSAVQGRGTAEANAGDALVYDSRLSNALTEAAETTGSAARSDALEETVARLWLASDAVNGANLLVALERAGGIVRAEGDEAHPADRPADGVGDAVAAVDSLAGTSLSSLIRSNAHPADLRDDGEPLRSGTIAEIAEEDDALGDVASTLNDPQLLLGRTNAEQLQLLSTSWSAHPDAWLSSYDAHLASLTELENAVGIVPPSDVTLLSSDAPLPVWVRNDLPYPATVTLHSYPDDIRLKMATSTEVEAQASSNTRVPLPVKATLGSGDVSIRISLESPSGAELGSEETIDVTVRADWERYGVTGLVALIALLVVAGTIRTVRRRRKRQREAAEGAADAGSDDGAPDGAAGRAESAAAPESSGTPDAPAAERDDTEDEKDINGKHR